MASPLSSPEAEPTPPDARIIFALQRTVRARYDAGDLESLTLRRVRNDTAEELGLGIEFFKTDKRWKEKSKTIINDEVERCDATLVDRNNKNKAEKSPSKKRTSREPEPDRAKKRRLKDTAQSRSERESSSPLSSAISVEDVDEQYEESNVEKGKTHESGSKAGSASKSASRHYADDDSELSEVLDELPRPTKRRKGSDSTRGSLSSSKFQEKRRTKPNTKGVADLSPQEEEIKRLQSQLVRCGIRKVWSRELAKFDSSRVKIAHLKQMLQDAGLEGRFSEEKARQIKEKRELAAELEAVQAYSKAWGKDKGKDADHNDDGDRPTRRKVLAKGLQELQDLADEEDSE